MESENKKDKYFILERSDIPQYLIDECEEMAILNDEPFFIFCTNTKHQINTNIQCGSISLQRDKKIDNLLGVKYYIGNISEFSELPSRYSYYDTINKMTNMYEKYNSAVDFIIDLGFIPSEYNLGREYDQSFVLKIRNEGNDEDAKYIGIIFRLKPNLFYEIVLDEKKYKGFYNRSEILNILGRSKDLTNIVRDSKLDILKI